MFNVPDQAIAIGGTFDTLDLSQYLAEVDGDDVMWSYEFLDYPSNVPIPVLARWMGNQEIHSSTLHRPHLLQQGIDLGQAYQMFLQLLSPDQGR